MKVLVFVKAPPETEAGEMYKDAEQERAARDAMSNYNDELVKAGVRLAVGGLQPSSNGARINFNGDKVSVTDGPFTEAKELVIGFWIWQVRSMEEAIEWAKRCPCPLGDVGALELRPIHGD